LFFEGTETNTSMQIPAFMTANFDDCEVVVEQRILNPRMAVAAIEPRCAAASWDGDHLTVYASSQGVHQQQSQYLLIYGLEPSQVRVITPDVGGGFGGKGFPLPEELLVAEFSRQVGRPVTWTETRTENLLAWVHGRGQVQNIKIGGQRDGTINAYSLDLLQDAGGYPHIGSALIGAGMMMLTGTYGWTNVGLSVFPVPHSATAAADRDSSQHFTIPMMAMACAGKGRRFKRARAGQTGSAGPCNAEKRDSTWSPRAEPYMRK
jgi:carbon-monoxide dehydrogenase large subunit